MYFLRSVRNEDRLNTCHDDKTIKDCQEKVAEHSSREPRICAPRVTDSVNDTKYHPYGADHKRLLRAHEASKHEREKKQGQSLHLVHQCALGTVELADYSTLLHQHVPQGVLALWRVNFVNLLIRHIDLAFLARRTKVDVDQKHANLDWKDSQVEETQVTVCQEMKSLLIFFAGEKAQSESNGGAENQEKGGEHRVQHTNWGTRGIV
mmetsp:Transcript_62255/g.165270  ORF Transcript_62255/g.165270 Transcript_62255/m.165270 type:complete len:207 (+) Transcript_62255:187-807(+)